jgi:hypothetical protein
MPMARRLHRREARIAAGALLEIVQRVAAIAVKAAIETRNRWRAACVWKPCRPSTRPESP